MTTVDWRSKGFWLPDEQRSAAWYAAERPGLFDGGFTWPVLVLRQSAALANIATIAAGTGWTSRRTPRRRWPPG
jgi:hypothetical protein